jgi:tRNA U38,U39,U40 pseudouridine synthase TruA
VIAMLLNPISDFFKTKQTEADSYVRHIKHCDPTTLEAAIAERFEVQGEFSVFSPAMIRCLLPCISSSAIKKW